MEICIHTDKVDVTPKEAGYKQAKLDCLDDILSGLVRDNKLHGASYLLSREGRTFATRSMGKLRHTDGSSELMPKSIRRIASITKWFTLVCILRLMEEGKLRLTQPVKIWIKEFENPAFEKINIHHLLTHTSGITPDPYFYTEPYPLSWWDIEFAFGDEPEHKQERSPEEAVAFRKSQWIKAILSSHPPCEPGKVWRYSSAGFALLGEIITRASGMHYDDYVRTIILEPLRMTRTFFDIPEELREEVCIINDWELSRLNKQEDRTVLPPRAGGGLYSTLGDLNRFGQMMLTGTYEGTRIISRKSVELLVRDQFPQGLPAFSWGADHKNFHYGLSCELGTALDFHGPSSFMHEGAGRSMLIVDPKEQFVAVIFVPTNADWVPESIISIKNIIWAGLQ